MSKRVLVGVPVYRGLDYVAETLRSLQAQTMQEFEVLISVDAADERSASVCRQFLDDPRYRMAVQPHRLGWAGNLNWLWAHNKNEFFCYYQQDDITDPSYFATLIETADRHPSASVVFCDIRFFGSSEMLSSGVSITGADAFERVMMQLETFYWGALRGLVRRDALLRAAPMRITEIDSFGEDFSWLLKLARHGELVRVPQVLYFKRAHGASISTEWFDKWPLDKRRKGIVTLSTSLLDAALPAARTLEQRLALFLAVVERLALKQWFYPVNALPANERALLVRSFFEAMQSDALYDHRSAFDMSPASLELVALTRLGLPHPAELQAATRQADDRAAVAVAHRVIKARIGFTRGEPIDFRMGDARVFMQGAWGPTEDWGVWLYGANAELVLWPDPPTSVALSLTALAKCFWADWRSRVVIDVLANDRSIATWEFSKPDDPERLRSFVAIIPSEIAAGDRPLRLTFAVRELEKPEALGLPPDAPILSLGLRQLRCA